MPAKLSAQELLSQKEAVSSAKRDSATNIQLRLDQSKNFDSQFPFKYHLPSNFKGEKRTIHIDEPETASPDNYNMPILKPKKTSKILIAELDPKYPHFYNMPVIKGGPTKR